MTSTNRAMDVDLENDPKHAPSHNAAVAVHAEYTEKPSSQQQQQSRSDGTGTKRTISDAEFEESRIKHEIKHQKLANIGQWVLDRTLGEGTTGKVKLAINTVTGQRAALKIINVRALLRNSKSSDRSETTTRLKREITILQLLRHPNIIKLYEVTENDGVIYIFMELAKGGELFEQIAARGKLSEKEARKLMRQICSAVEYCHANLVVHRDLKLENLLIDSDGNIKVIDFGFSTYLVPGHLLSTKCGSPHYCAPEVIMCDSYVGPAADVYSMGVILYAIVCGYLPFARASLHNPGKIVRAALKCEYKREPHLSPMCQDLIERMLRPNPVDRITLEQVRAHPWMNTGYATLPDCHCQVRAPNVTSVDPDIIYQLVEFGFKPGQTAKKVLANEHCQAVATYHLLLERKMERKDRMDRRDAEKRRQQRQLQPLLPFRTPARRIPPRSAPKTSSAVKSPSLSSAPEPESSIEDEPSPNSKTSATTPAATTPAAAETATAEKTVAAETATEGATKPTPAEVSPMDTTTDDVSLASSSSSLSQSLVASPASSISSQESISPKDSSSTMSSVAAPGTVASTSDDGPTTRTRGSMPSIAPRKARGTKSSPSSPLLQGLDRLQGTNASRSSPSSPSIGPGEGYRTSSTSPQTSGRKVSPTSASAARSSSGRHRARSSSVSVVEKSGVGYLAVEIMSAAAAVAAAASPTRGRRKQQGMMDSPVGSPLLAGSLPSSLPASPPFVAHSVKGGDSRDSSPRSVSPSSKGRKKAKKKRKKLSTATAGTVVSGLADSNMVSGSDQYNASPLAAGSVSPSSSEVNFSPDDNMMPTNGLAVRPFSRSAGNNTRHHKKVSRKGIVSSASAIAHPSSSQGGEYIAQLDPATTQVYDPSQQNRRASDPPGRAMGAINSKYLFSGGSSSDRSSAGPSGSPSRMHSPPNQRAKFTGRRFSAADCLTTQNKPISTSSSTECLPVYEGENRSPMTSPNGPLSESSSGNSSANGSPRICVSTLPTITAGTEYNGPTPARTQTAQRLAVAASKLELQQRDEDQTTETEGHEDCLAPYLPDNLASSVPQHIRGRHRSRSVSFTHAPPVDSDTGPPRPSPDAYKTASPLRGSATPHNDLDYGGEAQLGYKDRSASSAKRSLLSSPEFNGEVKDGEKAPGGLTAGLQGLLSSFQKLRTRPRSPSAAPMRTFSASAGLESGQEGAQQPPGRAKMTVSTSTLSSVVESAGGLEQDESPMPRQRRSSIASPQEVYTLSATSKLRRAQQQTPKLVDAHIGMQTADNNCMFSVDTTSSKSPLEVMAQLEVSLQLLSYTYKMSKREQFLVKCRCLERGSRFRVEIVRLRNMELYGLRFCRFRGNRWIIKSEIEKIIENIKL
eukprot:TRINITY_DN2544_c0_g4_i1.p1 TRINITY_DN2544_c0_g4~~TRINITY_DN2544_c0_g4_i1.p1  ORF type:complete len:1366 (+),score=288.05 TRINITY_DN2544_c0_g4_i1:1112-5209(+)